MAHRKSENAVLVVNLSDNQKVELKCRKGEVLIGRSSECDLIIPASSVSRKHARIVGTEYGYFLEDLSKNGTFINGKRIKKETLTKNTDIKIGPYLLRFTISTFQSDLQDEQPTTFIDEHPTVARFSRMQKPRDSTVDNLVPMGIVGKSPEIEKMLNLMKKVADTDFPVLIIGETGTGKELVARGIHRLSRRRSHLFVAINCSAIASGVVESELFGHEKGSFTGALSERKGAFEIAQGGTLFLDEIGDMPLEIQPKLLRALEEFEIRKIGGDNTLNINVRVIAATNRKLRDKIDEKIFRKDLFYRLNSFPINVPPLRDRIEDVDLLTLHFLELFSQNYGKRMWIDKKGLRVLKKYTWPGNIRELKNVLNRAAILAPDEEISSSIITQILSGESQYLQEAHGKTITNGFLRKIDLAEKEAIVNELKRTSWNKTRAAKNLGISKSTLFEKLRKYNIKTPDTSR